MVLQPPDRSLGALPLRICHFCIIVIELISFFSTLCQTSASQAERLTGVGLFILVCNTEYVPMVASCKLKYKQMYRLCDQQIFESMTIRLMHHYVSEM